MLIAAFTNMLTVRGVRKSSVFYHPWLVLSGYSCQSGLFFLVSMERGSPLRGVGTTTTTTCPTVDYASPRYHAVMPSPTNSSMSTASFPATPTLSKVPLTGSVAACVSASRVTKEVERLGQGTPSPKTGFVPGPKIQELIQAFHSQAVGSSRKPKVHIEEGHVRAMSAQWPPS